MQYGSYGSTYEWARKELASARCPKLGKPIANNTRIFDRGNGVLAVQFHATDVATYYPNGDVEVSNGGWYTRTTAERLSEFSPIRVHTVRGEWFFHWRGEHWVFMDSMLLPVDRRRRPTTLDYHKPEFVPTLREHQAELAERDATIEQVKKLGKLIVKHGLTRYLGEQLSERMLMQLQSAEDLYKWRMEKERQRQAAERAPIIAAVGKELRLIELGGGEDYDDSLSGGGDTGAPATACQAG